MSTIYDTIGGTCSGNRRSDPRIATAIEKALDGCSTILNVGAGTGSYEPKSKLVIAVEPSTTMISQRQHGASPVVQACAESLPFRDASFDAVLGILTVHHWTDRAAGLEECARVTRSRVVFLTIDPEVCARFWLFDYFPDLIRIDRQIFPPITDFEKALGSIDTVDVPIPADCVDGFLGAYWKRPSAYLDPLIREGISTFAKIGDVSSQLKHLAADIRDGSWDERYSELDLLDSLDLGYRLLIAQ
jgi:SAM-dependent methyltransferase